MDYITIILWIFAGLLMIAGLVGFILPLIPGPILLFTGMFLAAWAEDFNHIGMGTLIVLAILAILAHLIDLLAGALGAKRFGAGRRAAFGAMIGALIGIFFGLLGIIIGPFIGAFVGELSIKRESGSAMQAGFGAWLGLVIGTASKIAIGFVMIGIFVMVRFL